MCQACAGEKGIPEPPLTALTEAESRSPARLSLLNASRCLFKPCESRNGVADPGGTASIRDQRDLGAA